MRSFCREAFSGDRLQVQPALRRSVEHPAELQRPVRRMFRIKDHDLKTSGVPRICCIGFETVFGDLQGLWVFGAVGRGMRAPRARSAHEDGFSVARELEKRGLKLVTADFERMKPGPGPRRSRGLFRQRFAANAAVGKSLISLALCLRRLIAAMGRPPRFSIGANIQMALDRVPKYAAVHETAHAVALLAELPDNFTNAFDRVVIWTPSEILAGQQSSRKGGVPDPFGMVEGPNHGDADLWHRLRQRPSGTGHERELWRVFVRAGAIQGLAGPIAEAKYRHLSVNVCRVFCGAHASGAIEAAVWCLSEDGNEAEILRWLEQRAAAVVHERWPAILAVADRLLAERSLDVDQVRAIMAAT